MLGTLYYLLHIHTKKLPLFKTQPFHNICFHYVITISPAKGLKNYKRIHGFINFVCIFSEFRILGWGCEFYHENC